MNRHLWASMIIQASLLCGCNNTSSSSLTTLTSTEESAPQGATGNPADGELFTSVIAEDFVVACGKTQEASEGFVQEGKEAIGCAVLNAVDNTKTSETVANLVITATLEDESTRTPLLILADSTKWHYFTQLAVGEWEKVQTIKVTFTVKGAPISKVIEDPHAYDPESISESDGDEEGEESE